MDKTSLLIGTAIIALVSSVALGQGKPTGTPNFRESEFRSVGGITYFRHVTQPDHCHYTAVYPVSIHHTNVTQSIQAEVPPWDFCICNTLLCDFEPPLNEGVSVFGALPPGDYLLTVYSTNGMFSFPPFMVARRLFPFSVPTATEPTMKLALGADQMLTLSVAGVSNVNYVVEVSTDLAQWTPVQTNQSAPFSMNKPVETGARFYRTAISAIPFE